MGRIKQVEIKIKINIKWHILSERLVKQGETKEERTTRRLLLQFLHVLTVAQTFNITEFVVNVDTTEENKLSRKQLQPNNFT